MMKKILTFGLLLVLTVSYGQKVTGDYEKGTDFSQYQTYEFIGWQDDSDSILNDFDKKRLREAIQSEMAARNFELVESGGDIALSLFVVVDEETSLSSYTNYYGGAGFGGFRYGGWGNGFATTNYSESDYLKGTLVVDMLDRESKELIWQGVASGTINEKPEKREKKIPKAIAKLMKKFPVDKVK